MSEDKDEVIKCLKAAVLSRKGGVPLNELNDDYKELVGMDVPLAKLGHKSLKDLLSSVDEMTVDSRTGLVSTAPNEKTAHLHEMINKQKNVQKKARKVWINRPVGKGKENEIRFPSKQKPKKHQRYEPYKVNCPTERSNPNKYEPFKVNKPNGRFNQSRYVQYKVNRQTERCKPNRYEPYKMNYQNEWSNPNNYEPYEENYWTEWSNSSSYNPCQVNYTTDWGYSRDNYIYHLVKECLDNWDYYGNQNRGKGHYVIGDELMLDTFNQSPTSYCQPGMTIKRALLAVRQNGCAANMFINVGSVDILKGRSGPELILDMKQLIQTIRQRGANVILSTLAPMPGIRRTQRAISAINTFNKWVMEEGLQLASVLDINRIFKRGCHVLYDMFDDQPQWSCECHWPLFYWGLDGREAVREQVKIILHEIKGY